MTKQLHITKNTLQLYECPKCRVLRLADSYIKDETYFSTCHVCRSDRATEHNFKNYNSHRLSYAKGYKYTSTNQLDVVDLKENEIVAATLNAIMVKVAKDYASMFLSKELSYNMINMIYKLSNISTRGLNINKLNVLLSKDYKRTVTMEEVNNELYHVFHTRNYNADMVGDGVVTKSFPNYDLNPDKINYKEQKRVLRKEFSDNRDTIIKELSEKSEKRCYICDKDLEDDLTVDHIVPILRGGTNDIDNLAYCCERCNGLKASKLLEDIKDTESKAYKAVEKERAIIEENKILEQSLKEIQEKIEYYQSLEKAMNMKKEKNENQLAKMEEYRELVTKVGKLEVDLGI